MNFADFIILGILGLSSVISVFRGFVREVLSIVAWVAAFWVAFILAPSLAGAFAGFIELPSLRYVAAFLVLLIGTLIAAAVANFTIHKLVTKTGLTGTDRMLGVVFGIARGIVVVSILVLLLRATPMADDPWWREAMLLPYFDRLALFALGYFPASVAPYFQ